MPMGMLLVLGPFSFALPAIDFNAVSARRITAAAPPPPRPPPPASYHCFVDIYIYIYIYMHIFIVIFVDHESYENAIM